MKMITKQEQPSQLELRIFDGYQRSIMMNDQKSGAPNVTSTALCLTKKIPGLPVSFK